MDENEATQDEAQFLGFGTGKPEDYKQAQWLAIKMKRAWRYDHTAKRWHHWDGVRWAPDKTGKIRHEVASLAAKALNPKSMDPVTSEEARKSLTKLFNVASIDRALEALATFPDYGTDGADWDQDPYLLGCQNGVVDLRTNTIDLHPDPSCLVTRTTRHTFIPIKDPTEFAERAPLFIEFMRQITSEDGTLVTFLIEWFGASLFGFSPEQRFLLMSGIGRNGKGALKHSVMKAVGEYGTQPDANVYMRSKMGGARSEGARADLMELKGKRIGFFSEPEGKRFNEEMLKAHTGGDLITARALYSNNVISWEPTHSITFLVNDAPEVEDLGPSMGARTMVADFRERYDGDKEDKTLYPKLAAEADGVLAILCYAAAKWYESWRDSGTGILMPARVVEQSKAFMEKNDQVAAFINEECLVGADVMWQSSLVYRDYQQWHARADRSDEMMSQRRFSQALERKGFRGVKRVNGIYIVGLKPMSAMDQAEREGEDND